MERVEMKESCTEPPAGTFWPTPRAGLIPSTRASSGVMVAHLTATLYFLVARAESMVTWSSVWSRYGRPRSKYFSSTSTLDRMSYGQQNTDSNPAITSGNMVLLSRRMFFFITALLKSVPLTGRIEKLCILSIFMRLHDHLWVVNKDL